ncbi:hypothetical protein [Psychromonas sp. SP041]|uniref:hypothetical protein n=1 Tax=Psychromonas sp. SP041 TaxID=1365007 RepID=UPI00040ED049|nr:hypothetical protein [Psychromonas sp. SP041]
MSKKNFSNNKLSNSFVDSLPETIIEVSKIETKCKFNLSYFDSNQLVAQDFSDWSYNTGCSSLTNLLHKFKEYTEQSLNYWKNQRTGGGGLKVLEYYGDFPNNSDFKHPKHVPADAHWARFRLGNKVRLVGFVISKSSIKNLSDDAQKKYDHNTFYVVFLDRDHKFYKTEAP